VSNIACIGHLSPPNNIIPQSQKQINNKGGFWRNGTESKTNTTWVKFAPLDSDVYSKP
jgi:hypothetical protein